MIRNLENITIEKITWLDASTRQAPWTYLNDLNIEPLVRIESVGYVVAETTQYVTLAMSLSTDTDETTVGVGISIPSNCIIERKEL